MIALTEELRSKDTCSGQSSEDTEEIYKHYLVDYRNGRISFSTQSSDHQVIQERYEVRNAVLDHDRQSHTYKHAVELAVTYVFLA